MKSTVSTLFIVIRLLHSHIYK
jgi:hypothetical protein